MLTTFPQARGHFGDFLLQKADFASDCIFTVALDSPVLKNFLLKTCVGSRSPQKAVTLSLFLIFRRKCVKMGAQMEGERSHIFDVFSVFFSLVPLWVPLGSFSLTFGLPGHHFGTFLGALGSILTPLGPTKMMPRQCKI